MASRDLYNNQDSVASLPPAQYVDGGTGAAVDLLDYESALVLIALGEWTDGSHAFTIEESDAAASGFAAVAAADLQGATTAYTSAAQDGDVQRVGYLGSKRYLRVTVVATGETSGASYAVLVARGAPRAAPVAA